MGSLRTFLAITVVLSHFFKGFIVLIPTLILAFLTENFVSSPIEKIRLKNKKTIS